MTLSHKLKAVLLSAATASLALGAGIAPAQAAACPGGAGITLGSLTTPFSCTQDGYSFTLTGFTGFSGTDAMSFSAQTVGGLPAFTYSIQSNTGWQVPTGNYTFNYTLTAPSGYAFKAYSASAQSSVPGAAGNWEVDAVGQGIAAISFPTTSTGSVIYSSVFSTDTFAGKLSSANDMLGVSGTVTLRTIPATGTPSPLPILGATAAFGASRRLRRRLAAV